MACGGLRYSRWRSTVDRRPSQSSRMSGVFFVFAVLILYVVSCTATIPGADPTGVMDSAEALNAYLRKLCTEDNPSKLRPHAVRAPRIVVLDLASGIYRLDSPLLFNHNVSCTGPVLVRQ